MLKRCKKVKRCGFTIIHNGELKSRIVIFASYYRQLSADIKMKNNKIKICFVGNAGPKVRAYKTGNNFMIFNLIFMEYCV